MHDTDSELTLPWRVVTFDRLPMSTLTAPATQATLFSGMLQEFEGAARILNLEPGIWQILTHPKRQIIVSCPVQMDNGELEVFTGYRVQYNLSLIHISEPTRQA